jgi:excisionase family DNA binding protein
MTVSEEAIQVVEKAEKIAYNVGEAATAMGVSKSAVYHAVQRGLVPSQTVLGRRVILREDLLELARGRAA